MPHSDIVALRYHVNYQMLKVSTTIKLIDVISNLRQQRGTSRGESERGCPSRALGTRLQLL